MKKEKQADKEKIRDLKESKEKQPPVSRRVKSPNMGYHGKDDEKGLNPEE